MKIILALIIFISSANTFAEPVRRDDKGRIYRSHKIVHAFMVSQPCPAGADKGSTKRCNGYIVDHVRALACAKDEAERQRLDSVSNMQWQTKTDAKAKDKIERKMCGASD